MTRESITILTGSWHILGILRSILLTCGRDEDRDRREIDTTTVIKTESVNDSTWQRQWKSTHQDRGPTSHSIMSMSLCHCRVSRFCLVSKHTHYLLQFAVDPFSLPTANVARREKKTKNPVSFWKNPVNCTVGPFSTRSGVRGWERMSTTRMKQF